MKKQVAREIRDRYAGKIPSTREKLTTLSGVGDYVAGAVLSIAYNKKAWMVDSNVVRVYRRYFGLSTSREGRRDKRLIKLSKQYVSSRNPRQANLAILGFAALVCMAKKPKCIVCPLAHSCHYYSVHRKNEDK